MQQPPNPKNLKPAQRHELVEEVRRRVRAGVYVGPVEIQGTAEKLMEVLADDPIPHRPKRRG